MSFELVKYPPAPVQGGGSNDLGTNGVSVHTRAKRPKRNTRQPRDVKQVIDSVTRRQRRFELLRISGSVLYEPGHEWKEQHPTCWCHRGSNVPEGGRLPVLRRADSTGTRLEGVITCGLPWTCPVCAAQIAETRRQELQLAMESHCAAGGSAVLLTATLPHTQDQPLAELLDKLQDARKRLQNSRKWKKIMEESGRVGAVTGLEVTVGSNGWHPHFHTLIFCDKGGLGAQTVNSDGDITSPAVDSLKSEWVRLLLKIGAMTQEQVSDVWAHGLNVRGGDKAAEYVAKYGEEQWGLSRELASNYAKIGVRGDYGGTQHFTPFQLLAIAEVNGEKSLQARAMFREFAQAFKGRRLLTWSPGLKKHFGINDLDDDEVAAELGAPAKSEEIHVANITYAQFSTLTRSNLLGAFLSYVTLECADIFIAQDLIDGWIERRCQDARFKGSGKVLQRKYWEIKVPPKYKYFEVEEVDS